MVTTIDWSITDENLKEMGRALLISREQCGLCSNAYILLDKNNRIIHQDDISYNKKQQPQKTLHFP